MMQIAILHYHLNRGGVARVVENHLLALAEAGPRPERVLLLHGGRADDWPQERLAQRLPFPLQTLAVAGLDYDSPNGDSPNGDSTNGDSPNGDSPNGDSPSSATEDSADISQGDRSAGLCLPAGTRPAHPSQRKILSLAEAIVSVLDRARFDRARTILHWHNHALGKNVAVPPVVAELARRGYRMLLQIHDFAEDLRPDNYRHLATALTPDRIDRLPNLLYPQSPAIHYAVLNGRDRQLLSEAGVVPERLHLVPNPVSNPNVDSMAQTSESGPERALSERAKARQQLATLLDMPVDATWITYPVRGIRRKNIGEMLLWSVAASAPSSRPAWLHVTITPQNPVERASFRRWQQLAEQLNLPCRFGTPAGGQVSYEQILAACDLLLTTSVAEGFGMVFLECWLARRQLLGRDLPEITTDFRQAGICLEPLTPQLAIPARWIDRRQLVQLLEDLYRALRAGYGQSSPATTAGASPFASLVSGPTIDFARLPTQMQELVIRHAHHDPEARAQLRSLNRQLDLTDARLGGPQAARQIDANRRAVEQSYSLARVGGQLAAIYTQLLEIEPSPHLGALPQGHTLLESLLRPDRLHPIRIEP